MISYSAYRVGAMTYDRKIIELEARLEIIQQLRLEFPWHGRRALDALLSEGLHHYMMSDWQWKTWYLAEIGAGRRL